MDKLKPCPFCGCTAVYETFRQEHWLGPKEPLVFCNGCKAEFSIEDTSPFMNVDEDYILRVITAEGGADQLVCNGVTQCLYNACRRDDWAHSVTEILREYQYTAPVEWVSDEARIAWDAVFLSGVTFVDFGEALYFYAPAYCDSPWHESQRFVIEVSGVRFFKEVEG